VPCICISIEGVTLAALELSVYFLTLVWFLISSNQQQDWFTYLVTVSILLGFACHLGESLSIHLQTSHCKELAVGVDVIMTIDQVIFFLIFIWIIFKLLAIWRVMRTDDVFE
jgi:hypothetical protein